MNVLLHLLKKEVDRRAIEHSWFALIILVVLLSRIPFLANGYGEDPDAWRVYLAAQKIAETGQYTASRFPGYPVPEIIYSLLPVKNYIVFNSLTAFLSVIATVFFILILKTLKCPCAALWGLGFAFLPGIYMNSVNAMDYVWALCFALIALYLVLKKKLFLSAMFLGLAMGCRLTSGALLIPFLAVIVYIHKNRKFTSLLFFTLTTIIAGGLFFLPVFLTYGLNFISYNYDLLPIPAGTYISNIFIEPYGALGAVGICISLIYFFRNKNKLLAQLSKDEKTMIAICFVAILLYLIAYFRLPLESAYLIPVIPFLLIILGMILKGKVRIVIIILFILSPFFLTLNNFNRITDLPRLTFKGPILYSQDVRIFRITVGLKVIEYAKSIPGKAELVTYWLEPYIHAMGGKKINEVEILGIINPKKLDVYRKEKKQIIFLPIAVAYYKEVYGIDVTK